MDHTLSRRMAFLLFAVVVVTWGLNWAVTKTIVHSVTPLWTTAIRSAIATVVLFGLLLARGQLIVPRRGDVPVVLVITVFHMVAFSALVAFGLQFVPVGRSIVLGYTTPLWVAPGAWLLLGEPMTRPRLVGICLGLAGLAVLFNPLDFAWNDDRALIGNGLVLLAAMCWAVSILYVRAHTWISTPFQLVFWQALLATAILSILALSIDGAPRIPWSPVLTAAFLYSGIFGTALAYWAMAMVNRSLPATTTSLGILATPVVGMASSTITLGEPLDLPVIVAMALIVSGIAIGIVSGRTSRSTPPSASSRGANAPARRQSAPPSPPPEEAGRP